MPYPPTSEPTTSAASPVTASLVPPIPVPTHGPSGHFSVLARTRVAAPPLEVLSLIRNTNEWDKWNTFCPRCVFSKSKSKSGKDQKVVASGEVDEDGLWTGKEGWLEAGSVLTIEVFMSGDGLVEGRKKSREQGVVVTRVERLEGSDFEVGRWESRVNERAHGAVSGEEGGEGKEKRGYRIAWKSTGWAHWQLHSERVMEFVETEKGGTEYTCWETFGGLLGMPVKTTVGGQLVERFGDYARDVKGFLEGS